MHSKILDGKKTSDELKVLLTKDIKTRLDNGKNAPCLAVILVGNSPASRIYVKNKISACKQVGMKSLLYELPEESSTEVILELVTKLNLDESINGIIVQLPLPAHINVCLIIKAISAFKDVDAFHPYNAGTLMQRSPLFRPCTPYGVIQLLEKYKINLKGLNSVVVGASNIVGRPMALELLNKGATVTVCHKFTKDLENMVKSAELLVVAVGKAALIRGSWLKNGVIVVDVGINRMENGEVVGDVDFNEALPVVKYITPVPGGVGPMTVITLLQNTLLGQKLLEQDKDQRSINLFT